MAALGPAAALVVNKNGGSLNGATFANSTGFQLFTRAAFRWLWKSVVGVQVGVADEYERFFTGADKGTWKDVFFANAGVALPFGASIALLSYLHSWSGAAGGGQVSSSSGVGGEQAAEGSVGGSASSSAGVTTDSRGVYRITPTANDYGFGYTPAIADSGYFAPVVTGSGSGSSTANPYLLGAGTVALQQFTIGTYDGAVRTTDKGTAPLRLVNPGNNLIPNTADHPTYTVPLLGLTTDGTVKTAAAVSFSVPQTGSYANQIDPSSLQIVQAGTYLHLAETATGSGTYALIPDVYGAGIVLDAGSLNAVGGESIASAASGDQSQAVAAFAGASNVYANLPLITLDTSKTNPPLSILPLQRLVSVDVGGLDTNGVSYPSYNPQSQTTSAVAGNANAPYTYADVPVVLQAVTSNGIENVNALVLNPQSLKATVHLSAGEIKSVEFSQAPLLPISSGVSQYNLQLLLPPAVQASILSQQGSSAADAQPTIANITLQSAAYNNFVSDDEFSAQAGLSDAGVANAGVYLSAGVNDQLPLYASMGKMPLQNRVSYVSTTSTGQQSVEYLNMVQRNEINDKQTGVVSYYYTPSTIAASDWTPLEIYTNHDQFFTLASTPVATTIRGAKASESSNNYAGATFVAWVEASDPVIPMQPDGDGSSNYQKFMTSVYGKQRINYRISNGSGWLAPNFDDLYCPNSDANANPVIIRHLKAYNVARPGQIDASGHYSPGEIGTLLVWSESSVDVIKANADEYASGGGDGSPATVIKTAWINPEPTSSTGAASYQWDDLTSDAFGYSTIQTIPWDPSTDVGLTINDITLAAMPVVQTAGVSELPVLSWSQNVRTPYQQSVLDDQPLLYLQLGDLQSGLNTVNLGTIRDGGTTATVASATGLNFAIAGALPKSSAAAVQNVDGTGVLSTGLGTDYTSISAVLNNIPESTLSSADSSIASFTGTITDDVLTVSAISAGALAVGDVISGVGIAAGSKIKSLINVDTSGIGTYKLQSENGGPLLGHVSQGAMEAIPAIANAGVMALFSGSLSGNTLTVSHVVQGALQLGDVLVGEGVPEGTTITGLAAGTTGGAGTYTLSTGASTPLAASSLVAIPGQPSAPYTLEFWVQLPEASQSNPTPNPNGAGLVAFGQPSSAAVGSAELPQDWLLSSSFVVDKVTYGQAAAQGESEAITAIANGEQSSSDPYGWAWGLVATGAETSASDGTGGGSNLYSNALQITNLQSGALAPGMAQFLSNYGLESRDLKGIDGASANVMALVPTTQLQFDHSLNGSNQPVSILNGVAVDTSTAMLNRGQMTTRQLKEHAKRAQLNQMFEALWEFQQKTGEAKVNLLLPQGSDQITTASPGVLPSGSTGELYQGYGLNFALLNGPAVSVNGAGQLVFDVGRQVSITSALPTSLNDGQWHYVVASYLPTYQAYAADGVITQLPTNVGTATLYIDNQQVATQSNIINAYAPLNLNDQALLLANNVGGAIDQFAFYDKALSASAAASNASAGSWPQPTADQALDLLAAMGYGIATKTPDPGAIPGAVSLHWAASTVNPNDAELGTFYSTLTADGWTNASNLNPVLAPQATRPSASRSGSLQQDLAIVVEPSSWTLADWSLNSGSTPSAFLPAGASGVSLRQLTGIQVTLTDSSDSTVTTTVTLRPDQVLLGETSVQSLQPLATSSDYQFAVPTNTPAFTLLIGKDQLPLPSASSKTKSAVPLQYTATYTFTFTDSSSGSVTAPGTQTTWTVVPTASVTINVNTDGSLAYGAAQSNAVSTQQLKTVQGYGSAIATAAVNEQAPLQLKYIDSGEVLKSAQSAAAANSPTTNQPAESFGASQAFGWFGPSGGTQSGWLAIAQPSSRNASSDPAGRVWINYTGQFTIQTQADGTTVNQAVTTPSQAPSTWLNALAASNFSPDAPNLPLLNAALYHSTTGGLLIQADPAAGWGQNLGQTMLVVPDINGDGVSDLVLGAPQANGGGLVYIISGTWIQDNLTNPNGSTILNLANPDALGSYVTVLAPSVVNSETDDVEVSGFGSALAYDSSTGSLLIGAPNYLRQFSTAGTSATDLQALVPIGAVYSYNSSSNNSGWGTGKRTQLANPLLGSGGQMITPGPANQPVTTFWGAQLGTAIAVDKEGAIAVSAPGVVAALEYSGTQAVQQSAVSGKKNPASTYGDGALVKVALPELIQGSNQYSVSSLDGTKNSSLIDILQQTTSGKGKRTTTPNAKPESTYMQALKATMTDQIASATLQYNQALQAAAVGAVYLIQKGTDLNTLASTATASGLSAASVAAKGGATFYGAQPWNVLGESRFGSSLAFGDLSNTNNSGSVLAIGAAQSGGPGALYLLDATQSFGAPSSTGWVNGINLSNNAYLAHLASGLTLVGEASADSFGSGVRNLGDVNNDTYNDLAIQAFNAASGAGNGYVLFGRDQLFQYTKDSDGNLVPNPAVGTVASGGVGRFTRADGSTFQAAILSQQGSGQSALTGQGSYGIGDVNADGFADISLGSGNNGSSYLTWGHAYLEAINNLQLSKLSSDTGYLLNGLATATQGSLRAIGDFNGDGYGDFISITPGTALDMVRIELGANTQEILADYAYNYYSFTVAKGTEVIAAGDVNGDGFADLALFLNQNVFPAADGNQGAGSTTGLLFGRSSNELPIGSGFGLQTPVETGSSAPLAPLPGVAAGGLTTAAPAFITVGNTLYAVVQGWGAGDSSLWFSQSRDGGNSWAAWTDLSTIDAFFAANAGATQLGTGASLCFYNGKLVLAFLNTAGTLSLASWDPTTSSLGDVTLSTVVLPQFSSSDCPQLINRGDSLALVWVDQASGTLFASSCTDLEEWSAAQPLQQRSTSSSGATSYASIAATAAPSLSYLGAEPVLAVNEGGSIKVYAGLPGGLSWQLASTFTAGSTQPAIGSSSAPVLAATDTGLALTYTDSSGAVNLQRLDLISLAGAAREGVRFHSNGGFSLDKDTDLLWQSTVLNSSNAGLSTNLPTVPLSVEGTLLLANVRNSASQSDQIWLNAVPAASDPESTTWLNSTVQLADHKGGWSISQQKVLTSALAPSWSDTIGQSPTAPVFAQDPTTGVIFAVVQGNSNNAQIYWNYSIDGGSSWIGWMAGPGYTDAAPALTVLETSSGNVLVLAYLNNSNIYVSNLAIVNGNNAWSTPYQITDLAAESISLVTEANEVALYYQGINDPNVSVNEIYRAYTSTPDANSWSSNATPLQYIPDNNSAFQTCSGQLVATVLDGTTYLAYQGGTNSNRSNTIYLTSSSTQGNSASWNLISNVPQPLSPAHSGVGLTSLNGSLVLSYADQLAGKPVVSLQQGIVSGGNWSGSPYALLQSVGGTSTPQSSLLAPSGSTQVLVGSINTTSAYTSNEILTTLTAAQSSANTSTLSAVGDLNSDGYADLLVTANDVVAQTDTGSEQQTGLRIITGAATSAAIRNNNNSASTSQSVHLATAFSSGSQAPVSAISGADGTTGTLNLSIAARQGSVLEAINTTALKGKDLTRAVISVTEASQLLKGFSFTTASLAQSSGWGNPTASNAGSYGDLNGDGQLDYLAPGGLDQLYTADSTLAWNIWSIQAAGDVNGNGVDDVLLTLSPQGPSYQPQSNGDPSALMPVLLDGSLFRVVNNQFSFAPPPTGTTAATATTAGLRKPLNPFNQAEIIDIKSSSQSQYVGLLQNWIVPINTFQAGATTSLSVNQSSPFNPAGALSDSPPAAVVDTHGNATLIFTGTTPNKSPTTNNTIWCATQDKVSGTWTQFATSITNAYVTSPSATYYDGKLYVAYLDSSNNVWIAYCDASSPVTAGTSWSTYQVKANSAAVQTNWGAPALIGETGRLAMYFPSYTGTFNSTSAFSGYTTYDVNYLYSSNPSASGGASWGSSATGATSNSQFSGVAGTLQFLDQNTDTATNFLSGSQIAAVSFQGKTVLAFAGQGGGAGSDWVIRVATAPSPEFEPGAEFESFSTAQLNLDSPDGVGVGLTTDQASLFVAATASNSEVVNSYNGQTKYWTTSDLLSLRPQPGTKGAYIGYKESQTNSNNFESNGVPPLNAALSPAMYMQGGKVMLAGNTYGFNKIEVAPVDAVFGQAAQQSLSGFSIGGNIDNNGDGFTDLLISDPSDPAMNLDNQYVLFGGDYLDIASQVGTGGDDTLIGTPMADVIYTLQGADQVISNGGADVIYSGSGNDQIAISDPSFLRTDAGSGFDQLLLQGLANQNWDFRLSTPSQDTIYAGTQLKNIELISSLGYGANTLTFDPAAVNAINPDRVLFLALDSSDNAVLSGFHRNQNFDTSYQGQLWHAYATGHQESPTDSNPALVYVLNPANVTTKLLNSTLGAQPSIGRSAPPIPVSSPIASVVSLGDGLQLVGYKTTTDSSYVYYAIQRSLAQASQRAVFTYASTSINSANLNLGPDASGVAGLIVMEQGVTEAFISVPLIQQAAANRKGGDLALNVSQIADLGQSEVHIIVLPDQDDTVLQANRPTLTNFTLTLNESSSTDALLNFRADVNLKRKDSTALGLTVSRRATADAKTLTDSRPLVLLDSLATTTPTSPEAYNANPDGYRLDLDGDANAQVAVNIALNFMADNGLPAVALTGPDPQWSSAFTLQNGTELVFSSDVDLIVRRADTTSGKVSFGLQSVSGSIALTLLHDGAAGSTGSIDAQDVSRGGSRSGWLASEGKAIGSVNTSSNLALTGSTWTPTAFKDGQSLALLSLTQQGNQFTANFADGITGVYATPSVSGTASSVPVRPAIEIDRLCSNINTFGFYQLQDAITGMINGLAPSDPGYLTAALAASQASGLFLDQSRLPGFGGTVTMEDLPLDPKQAYGVIFCVNGDSSNLYSSFAQANPQGATQMISLGSSSNVYALGIEDQLVSGNSDRDYNDIVIKISGVSVPLFG